MARNAWVSMRCARTEALLTARLQLDHGTWLLVETVAGDESDPEESSAAELTGEFGVCPSYRGCVECGNGSYVLCHCTVLVCWSGSRWSRCPACGHRGRVRGAISALRADDVG